MTLNEKIAMAGIAITFMLFCRFLFITWEEKAEAKRREYNKYPRAHFKNQKNNNYGKTKKSASARSNA